MTVRDLSKVLFSNVDIVEGSKHRYTGAIIECPDDIQDRTVYVITRGSNRICIELEV